MGIELTKTQRDSVEYDAGDLLVKGVPGSGKSVVLMQRALRFNQKAIEANEVKKILILAYTTSLVKYTSELVDMTGVKPCMIEISTIDKLCLALYRKMTRKSFVYLVSKSSERESLVDRAIQQHLEKAKAKHRFHDVEAEFWADEFLWIKQKNITSEQQYIDTERVGRGGKVRMTKEDKVIAYGLFSEYCSIMSKGHKYDWEDIYTYLIAHADAIPEGAKYDYILVDEAQDMSYAKLKVAKILTKRTITIAADKAQKIYSTTFSWKELGIDIRGRASKSLEKTFRSSKQIVQLAESLLEVNRAMQDDQSEYTDPVFPEREGNAPTVIACKNAAAEQEFVIKLIREHVANDSVVGVLYRSWSEYTTIRRWLATAGIGFEEVKKDNAWSLNKPGVKVSTLHSSKGLEFDVIIIPQFTSARFPLESLLTDADEEQVGEIKAQERSLLYVGMTRAKYDLYLTYAGAYSPYLQDFEPKFYSYISSEGDVLEKPERAFVPVKKENPPKPQKAQKQWSVFDKKPTTSVKTAVQNGCKVETHVEGDSKKRFFHIDTHKYKTQTVFIGKRVGDVVKILNQEFIIDAIE